MRISPRLVLLATLFGSLALAGCKDDVTENPLLGRWQDPAQTTYEFKPNEVISRPLGGAVERAPAEYRIGKNQVTVEFQGEEDAPPQELTLHLMGKKSACLGPRPWSECLERVR